MAFNAFDNFVEIQKLKKEIAAKSGNLVRYVVSHTAETDGQRQFAIDISTFNAVTDSVWVVSGRTLLSATHDYVVQSHSVVLNEGVPQGRTVDIYIYKNVENLDTEKTIDGLQIAVGSIPLNRLEEMPEVNVNSDSELDIVFDESGEINITNVGSGNSFAFVKKGVLYLTHDTTGELYRLGLDDSGLYVVKQE